MRIVSPPVILNPKSGLCLKAAICNALESSGHTQDALKFAKMKNSLVNLSHAGCEAKKVLRRFCFRNVQDLDPQEDLVEWLKSDTSEVYLARLQSVRMKDDLEVDHVVAIDGNKGVIWDCVEKYGIKLSFGKLRYCVSDSAVLIEVKEMMKLFAQPLQTSRKKRKAHKMSAMKVKEGDKQVDFRERWR